MSFILFHLVVLEDLVDVLCDKPDGGQLIILLIFQLGKPRQRRHRRFALSLSLGDRKMEIPQKFWFC